MTSLWNSKLGKLARAVVENLPKAGEGGATGFAGIPIKKPAPVSFKDFIHRISLCESQDEIKATILAELESLERLLAGPSAECTVRAEALSIAVYCHLLGYDVRFIYIHAITLAQQGSLLQKRMGYLAVSLLVGPTDELAVLLINTVLGDLRSTHVLVVCTALNVVCHLVTPDNTATLLPAVLDKLKHRQAVVRDKAVRALHSLLQQSPEMLQQHMDAVEAALLDRHPSVMASAVQLCLTFASLNPAPLVHLTPSLMTILGQIRCRKVPPDLDHQGMPAPWLQCSLVRLISFLCPEEPGLVDTFSQFLMSQLSAAVPSTTMGFAVLCECIAAAATVPPLPTTAAGAGDGAGGALGLHAAALRCTGLMLRSSAANVRYAGLAALGRLCASGAVRPSGPLQLAVVQCLRDSDETVRLCALRLLHDVASAESAPAVCDRLREAARAATRHEVQAMLRGRALRLAERFLPRRPHLLSVLNDGLAESDAQVEPRLAARLRCRLANTSEGDARELRAHAAKTYCDLLQAGEAGEGRLRAVALWAAGELSSQAQAERLVTTLSGRLPALAAANPDWDPPDVSGDLRSPLQLHLRCLERMVWRFGADMPADVTTQLTAALDPLQHLPDPECADLARSCLALLGDRARLRAVTEMTAALLEGSITPDFTLSFADAWVSRSLDAGAAVMPPPPAPPLPGGTTSPSGRSSPAEDAASPFETLGPLQLPAFMLDDGRSTGSTAVEDEPPAVWTLLGRTAGQDLPPSPVSTSASHTSAGMESTEPPPGADDTADLREVEQLFPRDDAS